MPTPGASAPPRLVLLASALSPLGRQPEDHTPLCHLLDTNRDLCMSDQEVKAGWERWKAGPEVSSRLLLEAITLGRHLRYRYDASKRRFVPAD